MLKIKDNVDLKNLGFNKDEEDFIYQDDVGLMVDSDTRTINIPYFDYHDKPLNKLYDLIKADLVVKVESDE